VARTKFRVPDCTEYAANESSLVIADKILHSLAGHISRRQGCVRRNKQSLRFVVGAERRGRACRDANPADLPVVRCCKFEFAFDPSTAKVLGVEVPSGLVAMTGAAGRPRGLVKKSPPRSCRRRQVLIRGQTFPDDREGMNRSE
jgi:hypothetical protein